MGATGIALGIFIIVHMLGNLAFYATGGDPLNLYATKLESFGMLLVVAEIGLLLAFVVHIITAIQVTYSSKAARAIAYDAAKSKGRPTKNNITTRNMIITGLVLLVFLVIHIFQFRFGPTIADGYTTTINGVMVHDLYRVTAEVFAQMKWVVFYSGSMLFLGFHLRHGYWSAFQSLGLMNPRISKPLHVFALVLAIVITLAFFFMPIYMYMYQSGGGNS